MTESLILHLLLLTLTVKFSDVRYSPRSSEPRIHYPSSQSQMSEHLPLRKPSNQVKDSLGRHITRVKTVTVTCHEHYMEIAIKADLFHVGLPVDAAELRLGLDTQTIPACKVRAFSNDTYIIAAELTDCGTQHWITDDSLIYTNFLIFSPQLSPDGVIRLEESVVPIECYYSRKFDVTSNTIRPTWIPYGSTQSAVEDLQFSLKLMTTDWHNERASSVYFLGDIINMEASVRQYHHTNLHVYFESCVATVTPDVNSVPRYTFIENHGCLTDGQLTGSKSRFLPRIRNDKLQLQLDAFKFHKEERPEIYITCTLQAYPVMDAVNPTYKACSFIDGSWKSADGGDWACYSCQRRKEFAPSFRSTQEQSGPPSDPTPDQASSAQRLMKFQPRIQAGSADSVKSVQTSREAAPSWTSIIIPQEEESESVGWEQEKTLGPLAIFPKKTKMGFLPPPRVKEGVPPLPSLQDKTPMPHNIIWTNGVTAEMDSEGNVTHPPSLEPTEKPEKEKDDNDYNDEDEDKDDYGDASNAADNYSEEEKNAGEDGRGLWKTKDLPEDFEGMFTTRAPAMLNDRRFEVHALGINPLPLDDVEPADAYHLSKDS
ncbi:putative zona pellucida sperm-binding protein 3-like [Triplophysa rosa]|uniref:Zona pellucida sperm-binding protein 3 n=2 Tax=Triplophysa rosa TaxID=992332 RepID=A0A9W7X2Q5_TRIRA|nr:putative zona pellucida sperm-binding protein 3-like [Triplophysa rosa]